MVIYVIKTFKKNSQKRKIQKPILNSNLFNDWVTLIILKTRGIILKKFKL